MATAPGDVYEFVIRSRDTAANVQCNNVLHFIALTPSCTALQIVNDFRTNLETQYKAFMTTSVRIERYLAFNLIPFQTDSYEVAVSVPGTRGGGNMPPLVCPIVTWRSGRMGRRYRGRSYLPGLSASDVANGALTGANITSQQFVWASAMMTRYGPTGTNNDFRLGVWSRVNGNQTPPHLPAGFTTVSSFTVQSALGSMGTRRVGRGP